MISSEVSKSTLVLFAGRERVYMSSTEYLCLIWYMYMECKCESKLFSHVNVSANKAGVQYRIVHVICRHSDACKQKPTSSLV